jgi:hypothetical protein
LDIHVVISAIVFIGMLLFLSNIHVVSQHKALTASIT